MCPAPNNSTDGAQPSDASALHKSVPPRLKLTSLEPFTYSAMHLLVAIAVAFALTHDWRIALGVGIIEPLVQTIAYAIHEAAWSKGLSRRTQAAG